MDFLLIKEKAEKLAEKIKSLSSILHEILSVVDDPLVSQYEINQSIDALMTVEWLKTYFNGNKVDNIASVLPSNLPLYSLILFGIIPSFMANRTFIRPSIKHQHLQGKLSIALELSSLSNITISLDSRKEFTQKYAKHAKVVIFNGEYENGLKLKEQCREDCLFILNGQGYNPVVVLENANIEKAVDKTCYVKMFNNGQDCAGPDMIFVHESLKDKFIQELIKVLERIINGEYCLKVRSLLGQENFVKVVNFLTRNKDNLIYGGDCYFRSNTISPTILLRDIKNPNFDEIFGPIFCISSYQSISELNEHYFFTERYKKFAMYVSIFGEKMNLKFPKSVVLWNKIIHEVERANISYGGYGIGASSISFLNRIHSKPVLIPREIFNHRDLLNRNVSIVNSDAFDQFIRDFNSRAMKTFGDNYVFSFFFGSLVKKCAVYGKSDIDYFICVNQKDKVSIENFSLWSKNYQIAHNLVPDDNYLIEVFTLSELRNILKSLPKLKLELDTETTDRNLFDCYFLTVIFTDAKKGLNGDIKLANSIGKEFSIYYYKWKEEAIHQLNEIKHLSKEIKLFKIDKLNQSIDYKNEFVKYLNVLFEALSGKKLNLVEKKHDYNFENVTHNFLIASMRPDLIFNQIMSFMKSDINERDVNFFVFSDSPEPLRKKEFIKEINRIYEVCPKLKQHIFFYDYYHQIGILNKITKEYSTFSGIEQDQLLKCFMENDKLCGIRSIQNKFIMIFYYTLGVKALDFPSIVHRLDDDVFALYAENDGKDCVRIIRKKDFFKCKEKSLIGRERIISGCNYLIDSPSPLVDILTATEFIRNFFKLSKEVTDPFKKIGANMKLISPYKCLKTINCVNEIEIGLLTPSEEQSYNEVLEMFPDYINKLKEGVCRFAINDSADTFHEINELNFFPGGCVSYWSNELPAMTPLFGNQDLLYILIESFVYGKYLVFDSYLGHVKTSSSRVDLINDLMNSSYKHQTYLTFGVIKNFFDSIENEHNSLIKKWKHFLIEKLTQTFANFMTDSINDVEKNISEIFELIEGLQKDNHWISSGNYFEAINLIKDYFQKFLTNISSIRNNFQFNQDKDEIVQELVNNYFHQNELFQKMLDFSTQNNEKYFP